MSSTQLIYVALGSAGNFVRGSEEVWIPNPRVLTALAVMHDAYSAKTFVMPSLQNYTILHLLEEGKADDAHTWDVWKKRCITLIKKCDEIWVIEFPGWEESKGVREEMLIAEVLGITIRRIDPHVDFMGGIQLRVS